jgi:diguanylate cyclase (GGDEF)-like protein
MAEIRKKIIAVDDNLENLVSIKDSLKDIYEVYPSPSAIKLFELLEHITPDLILLDVEMPNMNGYEAAKKLKDDERYKEIPIIFLTIRDDIKSEMDGFRLGAVDYIHKPFVTPLLLQRIKTHLSLVDYQKIEIISTATITAMQHIKEGIILVDTDNKYLSSNPAAAEMLSGLAKLGKGESIFSAEGWPKELVLTVNTYVEFSISGNSTRYFKAGVSPVFDKNNKHIAMIILITDITTNVNFVKELEKAAYIDSLTGLYNRKHFLELATAEVKRAVRMKQLVYIAMLDFDFFKNTNDTYGHAAGDLVLKTTADNLQKNIRSYDLLCRYGGEEFVFLLAVNSEKEVSDLAERIREDTGRCVMNYESKEIRITCSIGLAKFLETDTIEAAIKRADEALYAAKNAGRNLVKIYGSLL